MRPKKKKITTVRYEDDTPGETPAQSIPAFEHDPRDETVQAIIERAAPNGEVIVKVFRITPTGQAFVGNFGADIDPEQLQARGLYGRFTCKIVAGGEFRDSFPMEIDPPPTGQASALGGNTEMRLLLDEIRALRQGPQIQREPIADLTEAMLKIHQMANGGRPQSEMTLDQILKCIEIGKSLGGNGGGETDWAKEIFGIAKESLPMLAAAMQAKQQQNGGMAAQAAPVAQLPEQTPVTDDQMKMKLRAGMQFLKTMALQPEADPGLWHDIIVARRNEPDFAYLIHKAIAEEFSEFVQIDADISRPEYVKFFRTIYDGLRSTFNPANTVDRDSRGPERDKAHVGGNGTTGKGRGK